MDRVVRWFVGGLVLAALACAPGADTSDTPDAGPPGDWTELITGSWTNAPASESYWCARKIVQEDLYIAGFRALSPVGTHHTVVTIQDAPDPNQPDSEFPCSASTLTHTMLFASGVGTDDLLLPPGVAIKVLAGKQINLNIHLFNVSDAALTDRSGALVRLISAADVTDEAEMIFGGTVVIPITGQGEFVASGDCALTGDHTIVSVWPHLHQVGTHMKIEAFRGGNSVGVLHDEAFRFTEQTQWPIVPFAVQAGDVLRTTCTWFNPDNTTIGFGDSSNDEMCFSGLYLYPPRNLGLWCVPFL